VPSVQEVDILDRFEREYQRYNDLTEERVKRQRRTLGEFTAHAGKALLDCGSEEFSAWLIHLKDEKELHVNTVRKKANEVRPFYNWCYSVKLIDGDRLMEIKSVKDPKGATGKSTPKPYSQKEIKRWRQELNDRLPFMEHYRLGYWRTGRAKYRRVAGHFERVQMEAIVTLALYCGLRRSEIRALSIDDMHPENEYIVVREGKGGKYREVPHCATSREKVDAWLQHRAELDPDHDDPWLSLAANQAEGGWLKPMGEERYDKLLHKIGNWHLHRFRHTCATNWLRAGMPLEKVQKLLGHATLEQTLAYAELVRSDIQKSMETHEAAFEKALAG
jgi:site-specific recombinase XerD